MPMTDPAKLGQALPLRDIHLPPQPGWWPPAPGWWLLLSLLLVLTLLLGLLWQRRRRLRYRRQALRELTNLEATDNLSATALVAEISLLLRRAALCAFPADDCASLNGEAWLRFLDRPMKGNHFSAGPGRCLATGPYQPQIEIDRPALVNLCRRWLLRLPPTPRNLPDDRGRNTELAADSWIVRQAPKHRGAQ